MAELEAYDPHPIRTAEGLRFLCPECGEGYPKDNKHRCFCVNTRSGAFVCQRCDCKGLIKDKWTAPESRSVRTRGYRSVTPPTLTPLAAAPIYDTPLPWRKQLAEMQPLTGTAGAEYLQGRGIDVAVAHKSGARFIENWAPPSKASPNPCAYFGGAAVMFPIREYWRDGRPQQKPRVVAAQGRYIAPNTQTKTRTAGDGKFGTFATPSAFDAPQIVITEAPIDALTLAMCGFPAIALCGKNAPQWLALACGLRRVFIAFDEDEPGSKAALAVEKAAEKITAQLEPLGATVSRLRPQGAKDWNGLLQKVGVESLRAILEIEIDP